KSAKKQVAFRSGPSADRGLGGRIDALVARDEEIRHAFELASGDRGVGNLGARAIAGRASIIIEPRVASAGTLPGGRASPVPLSLISTVLVAGPEPCASA